MRGRKGREQMGSIFFLLEIEAFLPVSSLIPRSFLLSIYLSAVATYYELKIEEAREKILVWYKKGRLAQDDDNRSNFSIILTICVQGVGKAGILPIELHLWDRDVFLKTGEK